MNKTTILLLLCFFSILSTSLQAQWEKANGLPGGRVQNFLNYGDTVLTQVGDLLYFSANEGVSWSLVEIPSGKQLSFAATNGHSIIGKSYSRLLQVESYFRTDDFFQTLHPVALPDTLDVVQIVMAGSYIYLSDGHHLYRSDNDGGSWGKMPGIFKDEILTDGLRLTTTNPPNIIQSTDGGLSWDTLLVYQGNVEIMLQQDSHLFVFSQNTTNMCYYSSDYGQNWQQYTGVGFDLAFGGFEIHNGSVYGFDAETLIKTSDFGQTWTVIEFPQTYYSPAFCGISTGNTLLIGGLINLESASLYRSTDNAISWQAAASGIKASSGRLHTTENELYAVGSAGLFQLGDDDQNWAEVNLNYFPWTYPRVTLYDGIKTGNNWLISDWGKPWVSADGGNIWQESEGLSNFANVESFMLLEDKVIAKCYGFAPGNTYQISTDHGYSFGPINSLMQQFQVQILSLDVDRDKVYVSASDKNIYRSDDGCTSWTLHASPALADSLGAIWFSGLDMLVRDDVFFIFNSYLPVKMIFSKDAGQNWQYFNLDNAGFPWGIRPINDLMYVGNSLLAASETGIYISKNDGTDWTSWNEGFPYRNVYDLEIHGGYLWAATNNAGIWKRPLADVGVKSEPDIASDFKLTIFPNPASQLVHIETAEPAGEIFLQDAMGKIVAQQFIKDAKVEFSVESLPSGLYQVIFIGEKMTQYGSLVVVR
jgi:hypothetical protein